VRPKRVKAYWCQNVMCLTSSIAPGRCRRHCQHDLTVTVGPLMMCIGFNRNGQRVMPGRRYTVGREQDLQVAVAPKHMVGGGWCKGFVVIR